MAPLTAVFPGPKLTPDDIAELLVHAGFTGWSVRTMGAIAMAESLGYAWAHGLNNENSGTPSTSAAYLAEGHGVFGMDDYWIPATFRTHGLLAPLRDGARSFSQLAKNPEWNAQMTRQVFLLRAFTHGWSEAYTAWSSYNHGRHEQFLPEASAAARRIGAIP